MARLVVRDRRHRPIDGLVFGALGLERSDERSEGLADAALRRVLDRHLFERARSPRLEVRAMGPSTRPRAEHRRELCCRLRVADFVLRRTVRARPEIRRRAVHGEVLLEACERVDGRGLELLVAKNTMLGNGRSIGGPQAACGNLAEPLNFPEIEAM